MQLQSNLTVALFGSWVFATYFQKPSGEIYNHQRSKSASVYWSTTSKSSWRRLTKKTSNYLRRVPLQDDSQYLSKIASKYHIDPHQIEHFMSRIASLFKVLSTSSTKWRCCMDTSFQITRSGSRSLTTYLKFLVHHANASFHSLWMGSCMWKWDVWKPCQRAEPLFQMKSHNSSSSFYRNRANGH